MGEAAEKETKEAEKSAIQRKKAAERAAAEALMEQIRQSASPFQAVEYVERELEEAGFERLALQKPWQLR